jgi:polyisoprenoid-binding protein YceI
MIRYLPVAILILFITKVRAQTYVLLDSASSVGFEIQNFGLSVDGKFEGLQGEAFFSEDNLPRSYFNASVKASTISTGISLRDRHLRKEDYFNTEKYNFIEFNSTGILKGEDGRLSMTGILSLKGVQKQITFPFKYSSIAHGWQFIAEFRINRRDFNVGGSSLSLSDEVNVKLKVVAVQPQL